MITIKLMTIWTVIIMAMELEEGILNYDLWRLKMSRLNEASLKNFASVLSQEYNLKSGRNLIFAAVETGLHRWLTKIRQVSDMQIVRTNYTRVY